MPSFGGYVWWSLTHLAPILAAMVLLFMTDGTWWKMFGVLVVLIVLGRAGLNMRAGAIETKKGANPIERASEAGE